MDTRAKLTEILQSILDDDSIELRDEMTAEDVPGWDSLAHLNIVITVEKAFGIRFAAAEIAGLKQPGQNIGTFLGMIARKQATK
jgi:acyl carrier protein